MSVSEYVAAVAGLDLVNLHWDERGQEVSASFEGPIHPPFTPDEPGHDHMRVRLSFTGVSAMRVTAWSHIPVDRVTIARDGDLVMAAFTGPETAVECTAAAVEMFILPTYYAAPM
ncbi:hypothetical protein [Actinokineospora enzanensis]|uniref:hypothetical protein n=1 Tax=Actinokineospora enzanensis TaxID=155975 RepID=UPI00036B0674|nr:hypothetical protein [Actinokineospora enzanensis]